MRDNNQAALDIKIRDVFASFQKNSQIPAPKSEFFWSEFYILINELRKNENSPLYPILMKGTSNLIFQIYLNIPTSNPYLVVTEDIREFVTFIKDVPTLNQKTKSILINIVYDVYLSTTEAFFATRDNEYLEIKNNGIDVLFYALGMLDRYTLSHSNRVARYGELLARYAHYDLCAGKLKQMIQAHDIGKLNVPMGVLKKKRKLGSLEKKQIQNHTVEGARLIEHIFREDTPRNKKIAKDIVLYHHERWDGRGYPTGLLGDEIPYIARLVNIVDSFDAMTTHRCYRNKIMTISEAKQEIKKCAGAQFDKELAEIFCSIPEKELYHAHFSKK